MGWDWAWHPHPDVWLLIGSITAGYFVALKAWGPRFAPTDGPAATAKQRRLFLLGVLAMLLAAEWPVHDLAEGYLYSVHMVQHFLLSLVAPPLLVLGTPAWLWRRLLRPVMPVARRLTRPVPAFLLFNAVVVLTHWPALVDYSLRHEWAHFLSHGALMVTAGLMWWPIVSPLAELPRLGYPAQMFYLFLQSILPTVPASFLTFGSEPLYRFYETVPRLWGISALTDMRIAGLFMKLAGGFLLWGVITALFFKWSAREQHGGPDEVEWQEVERQLNKAGRP